MTRSYDALILRNGCSEGESSKLSKLEALLTEGDTDDGDAPDEAEEEPADACAETCEEEPKDIADSFH